MCDIGGAFQKILIGGASQKILGGGDAPPPVMVRESPIADQAKADAEAASKAAQATTARRRRVRASSLLATGGEGDVSAPLTAQPAAKQTLGS